MSARFSQGQVRLTQAKLRHIGPFGGNVSGDTRYDLLRSNVPCVSGMFLKAVGVSEMLYSNSDDSVMVSQVQASWCSCVVLTNAVLWARNTQLADPGARMRFIHNLLPRISAFVGDTMSFQT